MTSTASYSRAGGLDVVTAALAVVGTAVEAGVRAGIGVADAALRGEVATRAELAGWLGRMRHTPGVTAARFWWQGAQALVREKQREDGIRALG